MSDKETHRNPVDSELPRRIVEVLRGEGKTLKEIGDAMEVSPGFVSLVQSGERSLTMDRLRKLEVSLKRPLPLLFMQAIEDESVPRELKKQYGLLRRILKQAANEDRLSWDL